MNKKGVMSLAQIFILIFGIIAIGYAVGSEIVFVSSTCVLNGKISSTSLLELGCTQAGGKWFNTNVEAQEHLKGLGGGIEENVVKDLSATGTPTGYSSHGYAGEAGGALFGTENVAPKGWEWDATKSKWIKTGGLEASSGFGYSMTGIVQGAYWALIAYYMVQTMGSIFGLDGAELDAVSIATAGGFFSGKAAFSVLGKGGIGQDWIMKGGISPGWATVTGIGVAAIIFYTTYKKESQETISFTCNPWEAPVGGEHCEKCNQQGALPCSEYQCRSLGQSCQLLNKGTEDEKCVWVNRKDIKFPVIKAWKEALLDDYTYKPDNSISPPDRGVIVFNRDSTTGCAKAFTPLSFGITTDEPAKCKLDYIRKDSFDEMTFYFGGSSLFKYNHTQVMSLPSPSSLSAENLTIENDGEFEVYVRCQDANGNHNIANFVFKYCVEKGPDTTPPLIVTTDLLNNMPIAYNQSSVDIKVYTNEPADCKWSHLDQNYDDMEQDMTCSSSVLEMNAQMLYECSTTLTGIKSRVENKFYFRCKDQPTGVEEEDRNVNAESYEFVLIGTQPLVIDSVLPNNTIKDSTETVKVTLEAETSAGYNEGEAVCYYSEAEEGDSYIMFFNTNSHEHSQELWLAEGEYEYFIKCIDLGGNSDTETVNFNVESDSSAPIVVRAYHEETYLKLVTNEKAECVYDSVDCSYLFDDGTKISVVDDVNHFTNWDTKTSFYVKCQDEYGNQPMPNECSIVVKPFEVYEDEE